MSEQYASIEQRIASACERSGRARSEVVLVGASKRQPLDRLQTAYDAGLRCFGENRVQEAEEKHQLLPNDIDWHLIGPLQSNKAGRAAALFSTVHSIDRLKIARALDRHAAQRNRKLHGFLQVNLGREESKSGFDQQQLRDPHQLDALLSMDHLEIKGLMAIPPPAKTEAEARGWFRALRELSLELRKTSSMEGSLSMGMSSDFEVAIEEGATHIRIGSSLFGSRDAAPAT